MRKARKNKCNRHPARNHANPTNTYLAVGSGGSRQSIKVAVTVVVARRPGGLRLAARDGRGIDTGLLRTAIQLQRAVRVRLEHPIGVPHEGVAHLLVVHETHPVAVARVTAA